MLPLSGGRSLSSEEAITQRLTRRIRREAPRPVEVEFTGAAGLSGAIAKRWCHSLKVSIDPCGGRMDIIRAKQEEVDQGRAVIR